MSKIGKSEVPTAAEDAAIERHAIEDDNPIATDADIARAVPLADVFKTMRTDYRVEWSAEDKQHVGLCGGFPSLSWLDDTPERALEGIQKIVAETIAELIKDGQPIPPDRP